MSTSLQPCPLCRPPSNLAPYVNLSPTLHNCQSYRVHKCVLLFFLEDDTIQISEPHERNSGIPQGVLLRRHRVPKDEGATGPDGGFVCRICDRLCSCGSFERVVNACAVHGKTSRVPAMLATSLLSNSVHHDPLTH